MSELSVLKNIVRTGWVSSVNAAERTAASRSKTRAKTCCFRQLENCFEKPPFIPAGKVPQRTETESGGSGDAAFAAHSHAVVITPWLPSPGDFVLCIYIPTDDGDGFVIGGI